MLYIGVIFVAVKSYFINSVKNQLLFRLSMHIYDNDFVKGIRFLQTCNYQINKDLACLIDFKRIEYTFEKNSLSLVLYK